MDSTAACFRVSPEVKHACTIRLQLAGRCYSAHSLCAHARREVRALAKALKITLQHAWAGVASDTGDSASASVSPSPSAHTFHYLIYRGRCPLAYIAFKPSIASLSLPRQSSLWSEPVVAATAIERSWNRGHSPWAVLSRLTVSADEADAISFSIPSCGLTWYVSSSAATSARSRCAVALRAPSCDRRFLSSE